MERLEEEGSQDSSDSQDVPLAQALKKVQQQRSRTDKSKNAGPKSIVTKKVDKIAGNANPRESLSHADDKDMLPFKVKHCYLISVKISRMLSPHLFYFVAELSFAWLKFSSGNWINGPTYYSLFWSVPQAAEVKEG